MTWRLTAGVIAVWLSACVTPNVVPKPRQVSPPAAPVSAPPTVVKNRYPPLMEREPEVKKCANCPTEAKDYAPTLDEVPPDIASIPDAVPMPEPMSKYGNPDSYEALGEEYQVLKNTPRTFQETGRASWYGKKFHGRRTANGEIYDMFRMSAAHKTLPLPSFVQVTNIDNGKSIVVRVNDRGPFIKGRIIDLSFAAATKLDIVKHGHAQVRIDLIDTQAGPLLRNNQPSYIEIARFGDPIEAVGLRTRVVALNLGESELIETIDSSGDGRSLILRIGPYWDSEAESRARRSLIQDGITPLPTF